jgi:L,D-transpeptidase YcbB
VKKVRFKFLMISSAFGLSLAFHTVSAQQVNKIDSAVPMPDTTLLPPPTANDIATQAQAKPVTPAKSKEVSATDVGVTVSGQATPELTAQPAVKADDTKQTSPAAGQAATVAPMIFSSPVAEKLHEIVATSSLERLVSHKSDREGIEAFYKSRNYAPIWVGNTASDTRAKSAIAYLGRSTEVGLDPADYPIPDFKPDSAPEALADAEIKLTNSALTFARHAQIGRIHFSRVAADVSFNPVAPEPSEVLAKLAASDDAGKVLDSYNPPQPEFKALRAKLAELRATSDEPKEKAQAPMVHIGEGKVLRPGMQDGRVIALRQRLNISEDKDSPFYDEKVKAAVKAFQVSTDIHADGLLNLRTVRALNGEESPEPQSRNSVIDTIIVNMERWRWFPRDLGNPHVTVNVPDYTLTLWNDKQVYWKTKIVAGKPGKATPMVSAQMTHITVNPTWNVPPSIIENEYLPALERDPDALDRIGLVVRQDPDGTVHISQPPGARNALGRIRFNFPNKFLVYQHDTPDKYLFDKEKRAFSHGCMRVQYPLTYGEKLLSLAMPEAHYTEARLGRMIGSNEINLNFVKPIWVHLTYQTAFVDQDGKLQLRDDIYRRDARMIAILKGAERKIADIAIERRPDPSSKPVRMPVGYIGGYGDSGDSFFDWLFGGGQPNYRRRFGPPFNNGPRVINGRYSAR